MYIGHMTRIRSLLVDDNIDIMMSLITGLWLANRMTNVYMWCTMRAADILYTMLLIVRGMRVR